MTQDQPSSSVNLGCKVGPRDSLGNVLPVGSGDWVCDWWAEWMEKGHWVSELYR